MTDLTPNQDFDKQTSKINNKSIMSQKERIVVSKAKVVELMDKGFTKEEIHQDLYPTLNDSQWKKFLVAAGLNSVKVKKIDFVIEDLEPVIGIPTPGGNPAFTTAE